MAATSNLVASVKKQMKGLAVAGLFSLWIGGKPVPAGRPRVTRWGTYYPKSYTDWIKQSGKYVTALEAVPLDKPVALLVEVITTRPKTTKHNAPQGDVDNFAKGPMDLLTKSEKAWLDDRQIVFLTVVKRYAADGEEPGFQLFWCEVNDNAEPSEGD